MGRTSQSRGGAIAVGGFPSAEGEELRAATEGRGRLIGRTIPECVVTTDATEAACGLGGVGGIADR